jgi:hypothetical protein
MITLGKAEIAAIVTEILETTRKGESPATLLHTPPRVNEIRNHRLELELDHRSSSIIDRP